MPNSNNPNSARAMHPITEDEIANYLTNTPDFFERQAQLLSTVQLTSPYGNRTVSLQERQAEMLRDKIKALEHRLMDLIRHGTENVVTADRLQRWTGNLLVTRNPRDLPEQVVSELCEHFMVPQVALRVWDCEPAYRNESYAQPVSDDVKALASSLEVPYCGMNSSIEVMRWLADAPSAASIALIPLRTEAQSAAFGMLLLASPDAQRFNATMGTDFLDRIGAVASAAISRLRR